MRTRILLGLLASAGAAAVVLAPVASADPSEVSNDTPCTTVPGGGTTGTGLTTCQTPGNVEISAAAPDVPDYVYPWNDEFYGSALIIGDDGPHGGGGRR